MNKNRRQLLRERREADAAKLLAPVDPVPVEGAVLDHEPFSVESQLIRTLREADVNRDGRVSAEELRDFVLTDEEEQVLSEYQIRAMAEEAELELGGSLDEPPEADPAPDPDPTPDPDPAPPEDPV